MKKITLLLAFIGMILLQGCTVHDSYTTVVNNTSNPVLEVTTSFNAANNFSKLVTITPAINNSDFILVYRLDDVDQGSDVWRLLPQKYYFDNGDLDYNFDFTKYDVNIFMDANFDMTTLPSKWTNNQIFRIVILPGYKSQKSSKTVDINDYNATLKAFDINPLNIKKIK